MEVGLVAAGLISAMDNGIGAGIGVIVGVAVSISADACLCPRVCLHGQEPCQACFRASAHVDNIVQTPPLIQAPTIPAYCYKLI